MRSRSRASGDGAWRGPSIGRRSFWTWTAARRRVGGWDDVEVKAGDMDGYQSVQRDGFAGTGTAYRVVIERGTRRILGAHLFAPGAEEVINLFALSVRLGLTSDDLGRLLSAYPSGGSNVASMLK